MGVLSDTVAIITGASSGIGEATAVELGRHNVKVVVAARRADRLKELAGRIKEAGGYALPVECDVTDRSQVEHMVSVARETFGGVDTIINNAGVMPLSMMDECRVDDWDLMVDVNIKGLLYGVAAVLPEMVKRGSGHIINISSVAGRRVFPAGAVYCGTKHAVHAISEGLRAELAEKNIRVSIIAPGIVTTELQDHIPNKDIQSNIRQRTAEMDPLTSEDIAKSILYAMQAPPHVSVNEILIRPTKQEG